MRPVANQQGSPLECVCRWLSAHGFAPSAAVPASFLDRQSEFPSYGNASIYYRAAAREGCRYATKDGVGLCLGEVPDSARVAGWNPVVVVFRPENEKTLAWLRDSAVRLVNDLGVCLLLKAVPSTWARSLSGADGFGDYRHGEHWHPLAKYDDQTYPEIVILNGTLPRHVTRLMEMVRPKVYVADMEEEVRFLYSSWREWFRRRYPSWWSASLDSFYGVLLAEAALSAYGFARVYYLDDKPCAFACGDFVSKSQVDLWASFALPFRNVLPRAVFARAIHECHDLGARAVNLGGSEESGLDWFKRRLGSYYELASTHVIVRPHGV